MNDYAKRRAVEIRKARFCLLVEIGVMVALVFFLKIPSPWAVLLVLAPIASLAWDRFCELGDNVSAMRRDICGMRYVFEAVVESFATVEMDDKQHGFNFVMDLLADKLQEIRTRG
jgi:hypothetical protein